MCKPDLEFFSLREDTPIFSILDFRSFASAIWTGLVDFNMQQFYGLATQMYQIHPLVKCLFCLLVAFNYEDHSLEGLETAFSDAIDQLALEFSNRYNIYLTQLKSGCLKENQRIVPLFIPPTNLWVGIKICTSPYVRP